MLENNTIALVLNFMDGLSRYIEYKKKCKKLENRKYTFYGKPVKHDKIRFVIKNEDYISESDSEHQKVSHRKKNSCKKRKKRRKKYRRHHHDHNDHHDNHYNDNYIDYIDNYIDCSDNNLNIQNYYDFLDFRALNSNVDQTNNVEQTNNVDQTTTFDNTRSNNIIRASIELPNIRSEEQIKLDIIKGQLDNLMSTDIDSLSSIMTIDYFDRILEMLNSIKQNIDTNDEISRNRLTMILHMIFSFVMINKTNVNLKKNIVEITNKYNSLVDKLYPADNFVQPLSREITIDLVVDPLYELYIKRYGLPKGTLFDNSKIMLLKSEMKMQGI
jgi:hypothetical protein